MDWESLKFFLAVARSGTLAGAGRTLGVKHSTVLRRIASLEISTGLKLFDRHSTGYALTEAGREMLGAASVVDEEIVTLERRLSGRDTRLTGTVRLATLGVLGPWLCEALASFRALHPGIHFEVAISSAIVNLARHEADIAVRISNAPPDTLVGRRIASIVHGVYAADTHPAAVTAHPDLTAYDWISYNSSRSELAQFRWVAANIPAERVVFRTNDTDLMFSAVQAGLGLAILPCYLGDRGSGVRRLTTILENLHEIWLLTHRDLRRTPRIRAVIDFLAHDMARYRDRIEGRTQEVPVYPS